MHSLLRKKKKILKVCITGAAGHVATSFVPMLANGDVFGENVKVHIKLLDVPGNEHLLKGLNLELQDGAYPALYGVEYGTNPKKLFRDTDVAIFIGGFPRKPGMELHDLLQVNGQIFKEQGSALNENAKKDCKCVVVANPANTNTLILQQAAPNIPAENFTSLTRLDQNRAVSQLALKAGVSPTEIKNVIIWGNHSESLLPDVSYGVIHGLDIKTAFNDDEYLTKEFVTKVQHRGTEVLNAKGTSSQSSAAKAIKDHLKDWYFGTPQGTMTSMGVVSDGSYGIPKGIFCSIPVTTDGFKWRVARNLLLDDNSRNILKKSIQELIDERDTIFGIHPQTTS